MLLKEKTGKKASTLHSSAERAFASRVTNTETIIKDPVNDRRHFIFTMFGAAVALGIGLSACATARKPEIKITSGVVRGSAKESVPAEDLAIPSVRPKQIEPNAEEAPLEKCKTVLRPSKGETRWVSAKPKGKSAPHELRFDGPLVVVTEKSVDQIMKTNAVLVLDFGHEECETCVELKPIFREIAAELGSEKVLFGIVDSLNPATDQKLRWLRSDEGWPAFAVMHKGKIMIFKYDNSVYPAYLIGERKNTGRCLKDNLEQIINSISE